MRIKLSRRLDPKELIQCFSSEVALFSDAPIHALTTDSREVQPGDLFIALEGAHASGQDYILSARARGASAVVKKNGLSVLHRLAEQKRARFRGISVAVTGSVGKTTTKEFLRALLSVKYRVSANRGNYNNELGVPLTLLSAPEDSEVLITELGMRALGEIRSLSKLVMPHYAAITAIGQSHLSRMGSIYNIRKAKFEITEGLSPNGTLFLGAGVLPLSEESHAYQTVSLSLSYDAPPSVYGIRIAENGSFFHMHTEKSEMRDLFIPTYGAHMAKNAALAVRIAEEMGLTEEEIRRGLLAFQNAGRRSEIRTAKGITVILDCYNSSPESMAAAAELLKSVKGLHPGSRAFALIGDMLELGNDSAALHMAVGQIFGRLPLSGLYVYGEKKEELLSGAHLSGFHGILSDKPYQLRDILVPGDILLVKASRDMEAEKLASDILGGTPL